MVNLVASTFCNKLTWQMGPSFSCCVFKVVQVALAVVVPLPLSLMYVLTNINASNNDRPGLMIISEPVLVHVWFNGNRRAGNVTFNVIEEAITHHVNEHISVPLMIIPLCLARFLTGIRITGLDEHSVCRSCCMDWKKD